ncbi:ribosomal protein S18-alanine N-acetyltransferase [Lactiplantibacillus xiangfangensis]|uniref:[Ribosomal protein bS18]-alanine N-acetyltransferase n=1 Tax=Lactiplantibacillus xiangfangensis TaxID=942150 RepID=A0A0R2MAS7_9LACO|nr:ribosomal protein S18-alanine N-acetyltransferase [Lactiplantibacillus xiangfangensis]KRO09131.1 ribosomal-protein-alanine N-acetyltransferase [Lactiplantibacillus xiangfangensis]
MSEWQLVPGDEYAASDLAAICYQLSAAAYPNGAPWRQATFMADIEAPQSRYHVMLADKRPVGFVSCTIVLDEVEITNIAVHPDFQRHGLARQLLQTCLAALTTNGQIFLEVRPSNVAAQKLYRQFGFEQIATRRRYYHDPVEDAWIMRKIID